QTSCAQDPSVPVRLTQKLVDEPGLADSGTAQEREQVARLLLGGALEGFVEQTELTLSADQRGVVPTNRPALDDAHEPERLDRLGLTFELERRHRLRLYCIAHQPIRGRA